MAKSGDSRETSKFDQSFQQQKDLRSMLTQLQNQIRSPSSMNTAKEQVESFFRPDIVSSPKYRGDPSSALDLLKLRMDSRGQPIRRTFIGNTESFYDGIKLRNSKQDIINQAA